MRALVPPTFGGSSRGDDGPDAAVPGNPARGRDTTYRYLGTPKRTGIQPLTVDVRSTTGRNMGTSSLSRLLDARAPGRGQTLARICVSHSTTVAVCLEVSVRSLDIWRGHLTSAVSVTVISATRSNPLTRTARVDAHLAQMVTVAPPRCRTSR